MSKGVKQRLHSSFPAIVNKKGEKKEGVCDDAIVRKRKKKRSITQKQKGQKGIWKIERETMKKRKHGFGFLLEKKKKKASQMKKKKKW